MQLRYNTVRIVSNLCAGAGMMGKIPMILVGTETDEIIWLKPVHEGILCVTLSSILAINQAKSFVLHSDESLSGWKISEAFTG